MRLQFGDWRNRMTRRLSIASLLTLTLTTLLVAQPTADRKPGQLRMALVNIKSVYSDGPDAKANRANIDANLARHAYFVGLLAPKGAEFVGFPELSVNGYHFSKN